MERATQIRQPTPVSQRASTRALYVRPQPSAGEATASRRCFRMLGQGRPGGEGGVRECVSVSARATRGCRAGVDASAMHAVQCRAGHR